MDLALIGFIGRLVGTMGAILVARTALRVHHRVWQEHRIDKNVFKEMHREQRYGLLGISAMVLGLIVDTGVYFLLEIN
jgi:hypothetical protein